jgi:ATP-dependent Clp endopeptidase proteolytic subunit ClpP
MRPCFSFSNLASTETPATLSIFDEIGFWGVQAKDFIRDLSAVQSKVLNVEINSPGGDVFAGLAIFNALRSSGKEIVVTVMGVAASAASLIAMAGDRIVMPKNTFMMVHNPWSMAIGNADELRDTADTLDKIGASLRMTYAARTGLPEDEIATMLATDTWLTADEALEKGFASEVTENVTAKASFDMSRADLPDAVRAVFAAAKEPIQTPEPTPTSEPTVDPVEVVESTAEAPAADPQPLVSDLIVEASQAAGFGQFSALWAVACSSLDEMRARATAARDIKALCALAKCESADAWIRENKSVADVRALLIKLMAVADEQSHTDSAPRISNTAPAATVKPATTANMWATHKGS